MEAVMKTVAFSIAALTVAATAYAASGKVSGRVGFIRIHDNGHGGSNYAPPLYIMTLRNQEGPGSCKEIDGDVAFVGDSAESLRLGTAAKLSGQTVTVSWDDTKTGVGGFCEIRYVDLD